MTTMNRRAMIALAAAMAAGPVLGQETTTAAAAPEIKDFSLGSPDAKVKIVEYASFTCPHCAAFHAGRPTLIPALFGVVQSAAYAAPPMRLIITLSTEVDLSARLASDADGGYLDVRLVDFPD